MAEMVTAYKGGNMVAVMDIPKSDTGSYGIVTPGDDDGRIVDVSDLIEKPDPAQCPVNHWCCWSLHHRAGCLYPTCESGRGAGNEVQLTDALARQIGKVPFQGLRFSGERFDCGSKIGFLQANVAFAMSRDDLAYPLKKLAC